MATPTKRKRTPKRRSAAGMYRPREQPQACGECHTAESRVLRTTNLDEGIYHRTWRRRQCLGCGNVWMAIENRET